MTAMTRQQRRTQEREDEKLLKGGLSLRRDFAPLVAQTRTLLRILQRTGNPQRASDAAAAALAGFDLSLQNNRPKAVACRRGCSYCCHAFVTATAAEAFLIARHLRDRGGTSAAAALRRVVEADHRTRGMTPDERSRRPGPCPMLRDDLCTVYEVRPSSCRGMASGSLEACIRVYEEHSEEEIPVPAANAILRTAYQGALRAALKLAGLPFEAYDLNGALRVALEQPDAEARWLAGEDVMTDVGVDTSPVPTFRSLIDRLAAGAA